MNTSGSGGAASGNASAERRSAFKVMEVTLVMEAVTPFDRFGLDENEDYADWPRRMAENLGLVAVEAVDKPLSTHVEYGQPPPPSGPPPETKKCLHVECSCE